MRKELSALWLVLPCVLACGDDEGTVDSGWPGHMDSGVPVFDANVPPDAMMDAPDGTSEDLATPMGDGGPDAQDGDASEPLTSTGFPVAAHCTPLTFDGRGSSACNDTAEGIQAALDSGIDPSSALDISVGWKELPTPMVPGSPYAISHEVTPFEALDTWQFEVWGVMSSCATGGEQAQLLGSTRIDRGRNVYCVDMMPAEAYTHVMLVMRQTAEGDGYVYHGEGYCGGGSCPPP